MKKFLAATCLAMIASTAMAAELSPGLKVGERVPPFHVQDVTGPAKERGKLCYRCQYGNRPVVSIFAREMTPEVAKLVKEIDGVVGKNKSKKMAAFVVLMTEDPDAVEGKLKKVASEHKIAHTPLTVFDGKAGPRGYKVAKSADVTIMMWNEGKVKAAHGFAKDKFNKEAIAKVVKETTKILN